MCYVARLYIYPGSSKTSIAGTPEAELVYYTGKPQLLHPSSQEACYEDFSLKGKKKKFFEAVEKNRVV